MGRLYGSQQASQAGTCWPVPLHPQITGLTERGNQGGLGWVTQKPVCKPLPEPDPGALQGVSYSGLADHRQQRVLAGFS